MTKLEGRVLKTENIKAAPKDIQDNIAWSIGHSLSQLHKALAQLPGNTARQQPDYADLSPYVQRHTYYVKILDKLKEVRSRLPYSALQHYSHCDFNISNILFDEKYNVVGILDFAEARKEIREKDISDMTKELPELKQTIIRSYETDSNTKIQEVRLSLGLVENALIGALIADYHSKNPAAAKEYKTVLDELVKDLSKDSIG